MEPPSFQIDGQEEDMPTELGKPQSSRPRRGELHGADEPWGYADHRGASERVRRVRR